MMKSKDGLNDLLSQIEGFITTKTVVGEAIHMGDTILLPLVDVTLGVGAGAKDKNYDKNGLVSTMGGAGAKMSPSAILVINNGNVRMVTVQNQDTVSKVMDMIPDILDRVSNGFSKEKENKAARKKVDEVYSDGATIDVE
ncbi:MAG: GerW family sporulation protein [Firmicutes bacterium]|nr:GerW family sporulation protein [Bacillota bacterium]